MAFSIENFTLLKVFLSFTPKNNLMIDACINSQHENVIHIRQMFFSLHERISKVLHSPTVNVRGLHGLLGLCDKRENSSTWLHPGMILPHCHVISSHIYKGCLVCKHPAKKKTSRHDESFLNATIFSFILIIWALLWISPHTSPEWSAPYNVDASVL